MDPPSTRGHACAAIPSPATPTHIPKNPNILSIMYQNSLEDVHAAVAALRDAGFENYSVDLIGGLPGQVRGVV